MTVTTETSTRRAARTGALAVGLVTLAFPLTACAGNDDAASPQPTNISIAPSSTAPSSPPPSVSSAASKPATDPSTAQSETLDLRGAVAAAEATVADSTAVEVSKDDDDGTVAWEVTVRAGNNGRELRLAADGTVLGNESDSLSAAQRGDLPKTTLLRAVETAEKRIDGGVATDAELSTENGQRVWGVSVDASGNDEWELWIDAESGKVLREQRD